MYECTRVHVWTVQYRQQPNQLQRTGSDTDTCTRIINVRVRQSQQPLQSLALSLYQSRSPRHVTIVCYCLFERKARLVDVIEVRKRKLGVVSIEKEERGQRACRGFEHRAERGRRGTSGEHHQNFTTLIIVACDRLKSERMTNTAESVNSSSIFYSKRLD